MLRKKRMGVVSSRPQVVVEPLENRQLLTGIPFHLFPEIKQGTNFVQNLTPGPDGNVYFSSGLANQVGFITPSGAVKVYDTTSVSPHGPTSIVTGPDGNVYFDELFGAAVGKITVATGKVSKLNLSNTIPAPAKMTLGPDNNLWIDSFDSVISRVSINGEVANFNYSGAGSGPIVSYNGELYFGSNNFIRRITVSGTFNGAYTLPGGGNIKGLAVASDGNLWFTEQHSGSSPTNNYYGYITPTGVIKEFPLSAATYGDLSGIASGVDGNIYFRAGDSLLEVSTKGAILNFQNLGNSNNGSGGDLITGPNGNLWYNESFNDEIGTVYVAGTISGKVTSGATGTGLAGVTVFIDAKNTGTYVVGDPKTTTDANGSYSFHEPAGTYKIGLVAPTGYKPIAAETSVKIAINQSVGASFTLTPLSGGPQVGLTALDPTASEGVFGAPASPGVITLNREGGSNAAVTVNLTVSGTALNGTDFKIVVYGATSTYNAATKTLSITLAAGAAGAAIDIVPLTVAASAPQKTVTLSLVTSPNYQKDLAKLTATITIAAH